MSFFAQIKSSASEATDLAIKEMLLGTMRSKDLNGAGILHASDFRTAVAQLGMPMGHAVVEEVLMHCKVSADDGTIDFSELAAELAVQRKTLNDQILREKRGKQHFYQSSQAAVGEGDPFARQEEQQNRLKADKFALLLTEHRTEIAEIFRDYSNHQITPKDVMLHLGAYGIYPNHRFQLIIEDHRQGEDLSFRDFYTALSTCDPNEELAYDTRAAGQCMNDAGKFSINAHEKSESERIFQRQIKRTNMSRKLQQDRSDAEGAPVLRGRAKLFEDLNPSGDAALYKDSSRIMAALKPFNNDPSMMLTHNKAQMIQGVTGGRSVIKYNVETKMTREQVLAALRRLDDSAISVAEFERKMYEIGIEIDPLLLKRIRDSIKTGKLDYRGVVAALDTQVFHAKAMDSAVKPEEMAEIKRKVAVCIKERAGANGLNTLTSVFRRFDEDKNGLLSYNEFTKACSVFGLSDALSDSEVRALFHELDINGDGGLDIREFTIGVRGQVRGMRLQALRNAYCKADTVNTNNVPVDVMTQIMQLEYHPDVVSGLRTLRHIQTEFIHFMNAANPGKEEDANQPITFEAFSEYWANVAFFVDDDQAFSALLNSVMGTGDLAPAPPLVLARRTAEGKGAEAASAAVQIHGDIVTWRQEASRIEQSARSTARLYKRPVDVNSPGKSTLNIFHQTPSTGAGARHDMAVRKIDHIETSNIFTWDTSKKGAYKAKERARQQWERKMDTTNSDACNAEEETRNRIGAFEIDEVERMAGTQSKRNDVSSKRGKVALAEKNNFGGPSPFATDVDNQREGVALIKRLEQLTGAGEAKNVPMPRALSELLKEKKSSSGPKSLKDFMDARAKGKA